MAFHPRWAELILSGKKNCEVRKAAPSVALPEKVLVYITKQPWDFKLLPQLAGRQGTIVGEFFCDKYVDITPHDDGYGVNQYEFSVPSDEAQTCMSFEELHSYLGKKKACGLHVARDTIVVYDEPKQLGEFKTIDKDAVAACIFRQRTKTNPDFTNGVALPGGYICLESNWDVRWCSDCLLKPVKAAPQSYLYVQEEEDI